MNVALRPQSLNIISLCTGGGGLDLGVELAMPGARSVCLVEREAFAASHLVAAMQQGLLDEAPVWSDVTTFDGRPWRGIVDGLIGGIPCQPHSLAGKRLGEDDERDLWSAARRIIVQARPWFVLIENVRGMLSSGGAERVWRDFHRLGFTVEGGLFTASEVGAPHERERIIILAVADSSSKLAGWAGFVENHRQEFETAERICSFDMADSGRQRDERWGRGGDILCEAGSSEGKGDQWQRHGNAVDDCSDNLGYTIGSGHHGRPDDTLGGALGGALGRAAAEGPSRSSDGSMGNSDRERKLQPQGLVGHVAGWLADPGGRPLFPPAPADRQTWARILAADPDSLPALSRHDRFILACRAAGIDPPRHQSGAAGRAPAAHAAIVSALAQRHLRGMADGMASRIDALRLLGNGVVCLEGAYAFRTLATRLAARGSAGAKRLVSMMERT